MKKIKLGRYEDKGECLVDDFDYDYLNQFIWTPKKHGRNTYAVRNDYKNGKSNLVFMHREILGDEVGLVTDHIDGNGLNNQRDNLRVCTTAENVRNRRKPITGKGKYTGVHKYEGKKSVSWKAVIFHGGKYEHIGMFDTEEEAARAYDEAAKIYFGEFAHLNFA